jgi:ribonucleotide monophosphatase NagD (HAD superfamily)
LLLSQDEQADFGLVQDEQSALLLVHSVLLLGQQLLQEVLQEVQLAIVSEPRARVRRRRLFMGSDHDYGVEEFPYSGVFQ